MKTANSKVIYIDMDDTIVDFKGGVKLYKEKYPKVEYAQSRYGFFYNLKPLVGAIETIKWLSDIGHDVRFLTRPSYYNIHCYSEKALWIQDNFGFEWLYKLVICPDKSWLKGDFLIDDSTNAGQMNFEGYFIHYGVDVKNWGGIRIFFKDLENYGRDL